jgi:hypothetical protein
MFDSSDAGSPADAAFGQFVPSGTYGNQDGATGVPIGDGVEFGPRFAARADIEGTFATAPLQVLVDVAQSGLVTVTTRQVGGTGVSLVTGNVGTVELRSSLFEGATLPVTDIVNTVRLEDVLADSFELKARKVEAQAPAVPSGGNAPGQATASAIPPAQISIQWWHQQQCRRHSGLHSEP